MSSIEIVFDDALLKSIINKSINEAIMHLGMDPGQDRVTSSYLNLLYKIQSKSFEWILENIDSPFDNEKTWKTILEGNRIKLQKK
jgi:hypothetical protein